VNTADADRSADRTSRAWLVLAAVAFVAFGILTWLVASRTVLPFDQPILDVARSWNGLSALWNFVSDAANFPMIGVGVGLVGWLLLKHQRREAVLVAILLVIATAGSEIVKQVVARPRPIKGPELGVVYSYASGHVLEALTILGIISLLVWRSGQPRPLRIAVPIVVAALVVLVAIARMALGEHYPSDVLGGGLAGIGTLSVFAAVTTPRPRQGTVNSEA
jgi:undecaprenyl-diphosphatase